MQNSTNAGEFDLNQISTIVLRRWPWLLAGTSLGILGAILVNTTSKPIWGGEFQIVLANSETSGGMASLISGNPLLSQLAGISGGTGDSELETEIKILESPLVLRPIFDYVKTTKASQGKPVRNLKFTTWFKKNLKIKLTKGTSVLNISYTDRDRSLVLPVLHRISAAYQDYSGRDRLDALNRGLTYVNQQVVRYRQFAEVASRAVDAYSIRYGIPKQSGSLASAGLDLSNLINGVGGGRQQRQGGALLNLVGGQTNAGSGITSQGDALAQLASINQELIRRQQMFTDLDPSVVALKRERDAMRKYIETTAGGNLGLPGQQKISKQQAQDIMLRYQELDRTAKRTSAILDSLERSQQSLQLEQARATRPWELISNPTVLDNPVSPKPLRNLALGLLAGLVLGGGAALMAERRSGDVFDTEELRHLLPYEVLTTLPQKEPNAWQTSLTLLAQGALAGAVQVALVPAGNLAEAEPIADMLLTALQASDPACQVLVTSDLSIAKRCSAQLLLAAPGRVKRDVLKQLHQNLQLQGKPVTGLLLLDDAA